ncbi:hypothetical protein BH10PLA2_BH10PLA2_39070 [soil metagenome]
MVKLRSLSLAVVLLASGGCGTALNLVGIPDSGETYPYGGTLVEGGAIAGSAVTLYQLGTGEATDGSAIPLGVLATVDLPFTIVGDTLTLPWTLVKYAQQNHLFASQPKTTDEEDSGKYE